MGDRLSGVEYQPVPRLASGEQAMEHGYPATFADVGSSDSAVRPLPVLGLIRTGDGSPPERRDPAQFLTISYPASAGRRLEAKVPYKKGQKLRHYLRALRLIGRTFRCRVVNGKGRKVRLTYVPEPGETIRLNLAGRAMS